MPKLYFYDTGLACALLNIESERQIDSFYMKGSLFENMIFSELTKERYNNGLGAQFFFMRDSKGNEVDCVIEKAGETVFVEIKMSDTLSPAHQKNIRLFRKENQCHVSAHSLKSKSFYDSNVLCVFSSSGFFFLFSRFCLFLSDVFGMVYIWNKPPNHRCDKEKWETVEAILKVRENPYPAFSHYARLIYNHFSFLWHTTPYRMKS